MNKWFTTALAYVLVTQSTFTAAGQTPQGLVTDHRIKVVSYDEDNVVHVRTAFGFATTIELQKNEYLTDKPGIGKNSGWEIVSENYSNLIVIKPKLENNTTNFNFTTNKGRTYTLLLTATKEPKYPTFRVRFMYSDTKNLGFGSPLHTYNLIRNFGNPEEVNSNYTFSGDKLIAPISAKDNGKFTLFSFRPGKPIPAILAVDLKTKRESLVNYRLQGGYVVVEGVYSQYTFRLGSHATCVFNERAIKEWRTASH